VPVAALARPKQNAPSASSKARARDEKACEKDHQAAACLELGRMRGFGIGGRVDWEGGESATQMACDQGLAPACAAVAVDAFFGTGRPRDPQLARRLAQRTESAIRDGCAHEDGTSCMLASHLADMGLIDGGQTAARAFREQTRRLLKPRCESGDAFACLWISVGKSQSSPAAKEALQRGCELGSAVACGALGGSFLFGLGVPQDPAKAITYLKTGCDAGDRWGCHALCEQLTSGRSVPKDEAAARPACEQAFSLFTRSCAHGYGEDCHKLASYYKDGVGVAVDEDKARELEVTAVEPLRAACEAHNALSCWSLAGMYARGVGVPQDLAVALELERTGDSSSAISCLLYAYRLRSGRRVERSTARAKAYLQRACDMEHPAACVELIGMLAPAENDPRPPVSCPSGKNAAVDSPHHCCFPRQVWSDEDGRCVGEPACPAGLRVEDETCLDERAAGRRP
jgi:TPR repeat protein